MSNRERNWAGFAEPREKLHAIRQSRLMICSFLCPSCFSSFMADRDCWQSLSQAAGDLAPRKSSYLDQAQCWVPRSCLLLDLLWPELSGGCAEAAYPASSPHASFPSKSHRSSVVAALWRSHLLLLTAANKLWSSTGQLRDVVRAMAQVQSRLPLPLSVGWELVSGCSKSRTLIRNTTCGKAWGRKAVCYFLMGLTSKPHYRTHRVVSAGQKPSKEITARRSFRQVQRWRSPNPPMLCEPGTWEAGWSICKSLP